MAYRTRVEAVYRQYDIGHGHGAAKEPERETVTFAMRRVEAEDRHRHLVGAESRPIKEARLAEVSDGRASFARSRSTPESHGGARIDLVIPDNGGREFHETATGAVDGDAASYQALVEAEYKDAHWSRDSGQPTLRQPSAGPEGKLLHADADPLRVFGPASETHPEEFQEAMARLGEAGVEVDLRPGSMSYSPAAAGGRPGRLILDPEASYGAVLHEMSHFSDDELAGFPGLRYWLEDPTVTADGESRAYQAEINYANSIGEHRIVDQLEELKAQRIGQLIGENDE
jgi:hypothetical protein